MIKINENLPKQDLCYLISKIVKEIHDLKSNIRTTEARIKLQKRRLNNTQLSHFEIVYLREHLKTTIKTLQKYKKTYNYLNTKLNKLKNVILAQD